MLILYCISSLHEKLLNWLSEEEIKNFFLLQVKCNKTELLYKKLGTINEHTHTYSELFKNDSAITCTCIFCIV